MTYDFGYRIVIVEDELSLLAVLARFTQRCYPTARVELFSNGAHALGAFDRGAVDLLVTNGRMPCMDGVTLIGTLRGRGVGIPILSMSGDPSLETRLVAAGATAFLAMPFAINMFCAVLAKLLPGP